MVLLEPDSHALRTVEVRSLRFLEVLRIDHKQLMEVVRSSPDLQIRARWVKIRLHVLLWAHRIVQTDNNARCGGGFGEHTHGHHRATSLPRVATPLLVIPDAVRERMLRSIDSPSDGSLPEQLRVEARCGDGPGGEQRRRVSLYEGEAFHDAHRDELGIALAETRRGDLVGDH